VSGRFFALRRATAGFFVILGVVIAGRGVLEAAPLSFTGMGLLMLALGVYRLRLMYQPGPKES